MCKISEYILFRNSRDFKRIMKNNLFQFGNKLWLVNFKYKSNLNLTELWIKVTTNYLEIYGRLLTSTPEKFRSKHK